MSDLDKCGFCAETHSQNYKCANCGHEDSFSQMTNFYEHKMVEWEDKTCPECGFLSLKPISIFDMLSEEELESIREAVKKL